MVIDAATKFSCAHTFVTGLPGMPEGLFYCTKCLHQTMDPTFRRPDQRQALIFFPTKPLLERAG